MSIAGYLNVGTALSGMVITPPPSGTNYSPQPVTFNTVAGGVTLNGVSCVFGPVSGSWGTLTCFNVTDELGNPYFAGTLQSPYTPPNGQLVVAPQGQISLVVGAQFSVAPGNVSPVTPQKGSTTNGSVALISGAYTLVLASGSRNMLLLTNTDPVNVVRIILASGQPASGALGYQIIEPAPLGTWPPPSMNGFVPTDNIWALAQSAGQQPLNYLTG